MMRWVAAVLLVGMGAGAEARPGPSLCDGKYAGVEQMLNSTFGQYGTLYAGSEDVGIGADVGATLDLYRLWHGLPDYVFRNGADLYKPAWMQQQPPGGPWEYPANQPEWADFALNHALPYALAPNETYLSAGPRDWVASTLDVLTVPGPSPDWWFNPDRAKDLSDTEAVIAWHARRSDLLEWLLGAAVQSAYPIFAADQIESQRGRRRQKVFDWQTNPQFDSLGQRYWAQYRSSGRTEWAVLAMLFPLTEDQNKAADALYSRWLQRARSCAASPAEYAAFAAVYFERSTRDVWNADLPKPDDPIGLLPPQMQDVMIDQAARGFLARNTAAGHWGSKWQVDEESLQDLAALAALQRGRRDDASYTLNEVRLMFVDGVDELADLLAENRSLQTARSIDLLSAAHLRVLAADTRLQQNARVNMARVAFLRLLALERIPEAEAALRDYLAVYPTARFAAEAAMSKASEPEVKLALAALTLPALSVRYSGYWNLDRIKTTGFRHFFGRSGIFSADLPDWLRSGGGLQLDVQRLLQVGQFWFSQKGDTERGMWRLHDRRMEITLPEPRFVGFPPQGSYDPGVPFGRLVALDELGRLGPDTGLTQRLSEVVIAWADAGSDTIPEMILQQNGAMPQALRQIVYLNRYRMRGDVDGVFAGKAAFRLLHDRFPLSAAARATPYWYKCTSPYCDR